MADSPTIVVASLSDEELRKSVNNLVKDVNGAVNQMATNFDNTIASMRQTLQSFGNVKFDFGGKTSGKSKLASELKEQTDAMNKQEQAAVSLGKVISDTSDKENKAAQTKKNLALTSDQEALALEKAAEAQRDKAAAGKTDISSMRAYTDEVLKQAKAIRESAELRNTGRFTINDKSGDTYFILGNEKKYGSIESQIVQLEQIRINNAKELFSEQGKNEKTAEQQLAVEEKLNQAEEKRLNIEKEVSKTKREYLSPTTTAYNNANDNMRRWYSKQIGVSESSMVGDETTMSIKKLTSHIKELQDAYAKLKAEDRNSSFGASLISRIQVLQKELNDAQKAMSRPTNLRSVLGIDVKTIDDITYKIQRLNSFKTGLNIEDPRSLGAMKQIDKEISRLKKQYDDLMGKNQQMISSNTALGRSWNYMKNRLAFYFTVGASTQFINNLIEVRSQYEMNERALGILIDSAERGTRIFNELSQMALVSPYTLIELSTAAKQLTAYDIAAKNVVDTTRRLADMASAVGIPIERLTYALGQIKAYGYLNSRDARMFSNAGIPLVKQLADYYTELEGKMVSTADVYDRMKKKAIDYNEVMSVIYKMTDEGGKFFDFQAKMAETLKVQLANLTLAWNNMLNDIGASEQGTISTGIRLLKELFLEWKNISKMVTNLAIGFGIVKAAQLAYYGVVMGTNKAIALETVLGERLSKNLRSLTLSMNAASMSSTALWVGIATFAAAAAVDILQGNEAMKEFNKTLRENAENTYNDLKKFSENYSSLRESLYKTENGKQTPVDIDNEEAKKAWEVLREQIELSSHASDEYIGKLLSIENVSERLRQGFAMIESIQSVSAAIKEIGDSAIKLERDWSAWWNFGLLPDGTIGNLQDAYMWLEKMNEEFGSIDNTKLLTEVDELDNGLKNVFKTKAKEYIENYEAELEKFRKDIEVTRQSIIDFIELKGWSGDTSKINEVFKTFTDNLILKNQLNPQQAYILQLEMEEARSKAAKQVQYARIKDLERAYLIENDKRHKEELAKEYKKEVEIYNNWNNFNGRKKVEWERFTAWLKEQHISETTAMFRDMEAKDIKSINFMEGKHADWVNRMVTQYAKEHKMSIDDVFGYLKDFVDDANTWSVTIPVMLDVKEQSDFQKEFNKRVKDTYGTTTLNFATVAPEQGQDLIEWTKKRQESLEKLHTAETEYARDNSEWGKKQLRNTRDQIALEKKALDLFNQKYVKDKKGSGNKKDKVLEDLKMEIDLIKKAQSEYDKLTKAGYTSSEALKTVRGMYSNTISLLNTKMAAYGLPKIDLSMIEGKDPNKVLDFFTKLKALLESKGLSNLERMKAVEGVINEFTVSAKTYNMEKITKGIEKELGKLKNEYDLSIELEATPEMGNMFAQMFGINKNQLPQSFEQLVKKAQDVINNELSKNKFTGVSIDIDSLLNKNAWDKFVKSYGGEFENDFIKSIENVRNYLNEARKKEASESIKAWQSLISKYGDIRSKMLKIYKDSVKEQIDIVNRFGSVQQKEESAKIMAKVTISDSPEDIAKLQEEVSAMIKNISVGAPAVLDISKSITNKQKSDTSKAMWEDFKGGDLYTATFEDMSRMSTSAIQMILDKLEILKDKVKDDPASMKALMKSMKDARNELESRSPYTAIVDGIDELKESYKEAKTAEEALSDARKHQESAQVALQMAEAVGDTNDITIARERLAEANKNVETAELNLSKAQSKTKSAFTKIQNGMKGLQDQLGNVSGAFSAVSNMFKKFGDDDTAEAIDAINEGFSVMASVISAVIAVMLILEAEQPILLAIAATLGVIIGLANMLSGVNDKKITKQIEDSQRAVRRLELAYIDLQHAIDDAYGSATIGAKKAAVANKELQLAELKRQLSLEESRSGKKRDQGKIDDLKKQVKELEYEIKDAADEIVNDLLGISSVGDAMESLMENFIDALRNGEDAMQVFGDSIDSMIANMIKKMFVSKVLAPWFEEQWNTIQKQIDARAKNLPDKVAEISNRVSNAKMVDENNNNSLVDGLRALGFSEQDIHNLIWYDEKGQFDRGQKGSNERLRKAYREALSKAEKQQEELNKQLTDATTISAGDIRRYAELLRSGQPIMEGSMQEIQSLLEELGLINSSTDDNLSALQQGIQGITEETAGALEAYANSISQQVYLQSDLLTQIRDVIVNIDYDIHLDLQAQILLQMQQSYQVQMAIHNLLNNTLNPSGMAFNVNILS